jgi:VIT1/CCC1 family predicted Fe2+/Mn2+ transporter
MIRTRLADNEGKPAAAIGQIKSLIDALMDSRSKPFDRILDPMERISETLFGVIMALTFTCALGVATADNVKIHTMLVGALGCNLAWGIIDAGMYLFARLYEAGTKIEMLRAFHAAPDGVAARSIIAKTLPPLFASAISDDQLESMREKLRHEPIPLGGPRLTKRDWLGALAAGLLCFVSTFPIALPFIFMGDPKSALRTSNALAAAMLAVCGYMFGYRSGLWPWAVALAMIAFGGTMVAIAIALGG